MSRMREEALECAAVAARSLAQVLPLAMAEGAHWARSEVWHVEVLGRGSSSHAGTLLRYALAQRCGLSVSAALPLLAAQGRTYRPVPGSVLVAISQSGGSPDLLRYAQACVEAGMRTVGLINAAGSPLASSCTVEVPLGAGSEQAVAATKSTLAAGLAGLGLAAGYLAQVGDAALLEALYTLPDRLQQAQACDWSAWAEQIPQARTVFVLARGATLGVAKEFALKIAETTGVPAAAYSSAEFLHGPIGSVSAQTPVIGLCSDEATCASVLQALDRAAQHGAPTLLAASRIADGLPLPPAVEPFTDALAMLLPGYLAIEAAATAMGRNPDAPFGLAKVTRTQ